MIAGWIHCQSFPIGVNRRIGGVPPPDWPRSLGRIFPQGHNEPKYSPFAQVMEGSKKDSLVIGSRSPDSTKRLQYVKGFGRRRFSSSDPPLRLKERILRQHGCVRLQREAEFLHIDPGCRGSLPLEGARQRSGLPKPLSLIHI